jgi:hypothetical protein
MRIQILIRIQTTADPCKSGSCSLKVDFFYMKIILQVQVGKMLKKNHTYDGTKAFFERQNPGLFENFMANFHAPGSGSGTAFPIRIRIQNS